MNFNTSIKKLIGKNIVPTGYMYEKNWGYGVSLKDV